MAKKKVLTVVKIQIPAGQASPAPPVGTALGPHGVAIMDFCKEYNARTEDKRGQIVPVEISVYEDRSFTFVTRTPPTSFLIRQAAGGGNRPEHGHRGRLIAARHATTDRIEGRHPRVVPGQGSTSPRWRKRPNRGSRE